MHRLFVAIRPPEPVRAQLLDLMGGIAGARWQDDDQLHLTLRFIGEVDRHLAQDVHAALSAVHHPPFAIALSGIGLFDRRGIPTSLWAGIAPPEPVRALHKKVDQAIARIGLPPETRAFLPHITIARLNRSAGAVHAFAAQHGGLTGALVPVTSFKLFESRLTPDGSEYTEVEDYPLR